MSVKIQKPFVIGLLLILMSCGSFAYQIYSAPTNLFVYFDIPTSYLNLDGREVRARLAEDRQGLFGSCEKPLSKLEAENEFLARRRGAIFQHPTSFVLLFNDESWDHRCIKTQIHEGAASLKTARLSVNKSQLDGIDLIDLEDYCKPFAGEGNETFLAEKFTLARISDVQQIGNVLSWAKRNDTLGLKPLARAKSDEDFCLLSRLEVSALFLSSKGLIITKATLVDYVQMLDSQLDLLSVKDVIRTKERPQPKPTPILVILTAAFFLFGSLLIVSSSNENSA